MGDNKNDHVVIALFESEDFANYGIDLLKKWDYADGDVKLGTIGTIKMMDGKVETHIPHKVGTGAKAGAAVGVIAAVLTGGTSWIVGALAGTALGGIFGGAFKKSTHLTTTEIDALGKQLDQGKVAVVVTCDEHEVEALSQKLTQYGGDLTTYEMPEGALTEAADAMAAQETTPEAPGDSAASDAPAGDATPSDATPKDASMAAPSVDA